MHFCLPCALPDGHEPVLLGVEDAALLPHGLRVGDGGGEEAVPLHPAVEAGPVVVPVPGVRQAPRDQRVLKRHEEIPQGKMFNPNLKHWAHQIILLYVHLIPINKCVKIFCPKNEKNKAIFLLNVFGELFKLGMGRLSSLLELFDTIWLQ